MFLRSYLFIFTWISVFVTVRKLFVLLFRAEVNFDQVTHWQHLCARVLCLRGLLLHLTQSIYNDSEQSNSPGMFSTCPYNMVSWLAGLTFLGFVLSRSLLMEWVDSLNGPYGTLQKEV